MRSARNTAPAPLPLPPISRTSGGRRRAWMDKRGSADPMNAPMSIYEVPLGSLAQEKQTGKDGCYAYVEAPKGLADYVTDMGYTHVELMGIAEHPYDGSWGYQVTGYFAPYLPLRNASGIHVLYQLHAQKRNRVILDWVPAHFPRDAHGLSEFDGERSMNMPIPERGAPGLGNQGI